MQGTVAALLAVAATVGEIVDEKGLPDLRRKRREKFGDVQGSVASGGASVTVNALHGLGNHLEKGVADPDSLVKFAAVSLKLRTATVSTWRK